MALDSYRIKETKEKELEKIDSKKVASDIRSLKDLIDSLPTDMDEDIDIKWIKENETSEGKINLTSSVSNDDDKMPDLSELEDIPLFSDEQEEVMPSLSDLEDIPLSSEEQEEVMPDLSDLEDIDIKKESNQKPLELVEYIRSLEEKYKTDAYHRMMTPVETMKFMSLYADAHNVDIREVKEMLEDTIQKQLTAEKTETDIRIQGLEQEKCRLLSIEYMSKYGRNFITKLTPEELEQYATLYLRSYDIRRSDFDKMVDNSFNMAYEEKITKGSEERADEIINGMAAGIIDENGNTISQSHQNSGIGYKGFSILKLFLLTVSTFIASVLFIGLYFAFK